MELTGRVAVVVDDADESAEAAARIGADELSRWTHPEETTVGIS